jgi:hypothetical protein
MPTEDTIEQSLNLRKVGGGESALLSRQRSRLSCRAPLMKTDHDLLTAFVDAFLASAGGDPVLQQSLLKDAKRLFHPTGPPKALTDEEFESRLAAMRAEIPAFLQALQKAADQ